MDYGSVDGVRIITGLTVDDVSDEDVSMLLTYARRRFFADVLVGVTRELIEPITPDRKVFQLTKYPIGSPENGMNPQPSDVVVETMSTAPSFNMWGTIPVESIDAAHGLIRLAAEPPAGVYVFASYYYAPTALADDDINEAVNYLTAHLLTLRLEDPGTISINDLVSNALVFKENKPTRFLDAYRAKIDGMVGGVTFGAVIL